MTRRLMASVCCVVVASVALSACGNARKTLGLEKKAPDEFAVVARAPLALPPDYNLRPPEPGKERPQEKNTAEQAKAAMMGSGSGGFTYGSMGGYGMGGGGVSQGQAAFLKEAGADRAQSDIRQVINRESSIMAEEEKSFTDQLIFWRAPQPEGTVVNADEESKRIRNNQALGKSVSDGETPKIERRQRGILEGIF